MATGFLITWIRRGKCNRQQCRAACCRALNLDAGTFDNDMGITPDEIQVLFADYSCTNINELSDSFDCKIYKNRPTLCKEFPSSPWDRIYQRIKSKCAFWFEIEIKKIEFPLSPSPMDSPSPSPSVDNDDGGD